MILDRRWTEARSDEASGWASSPGGGEYGPPNLKVKGWVGTFLWGVFVGGLAVALAVALWFGPRFDKDTRRLDEDVKRVDEIEHYCTGLEQRLHDCLQGSSWGDGGAGP